jgi:hypothetical protein
VGLLVLAGFASCKQRSEPHRIECFDATPANTSASTKKVFAARHCQGGGVTWAGILEVLARRRGSVTAVETPTPGWTGAVYMLGATRFAIDEEGDAARFCSDEPALLVSMRTEHARMNADEAALTRALNEAPALQVECSEPDGSPPKLPANMFPVPEQR